MKEQEKPFKILLSREQQQFLKEIKVHLKEFLEISQQEEEPDADMLKERLIIEAVFSLPIAEQNLFLIKTYGQYKSTTQLANELHITKQTICGRIRSIKHAIKKAVESKL